MNKKDWTIIELERKIKMAEYELGEASKFETVSLYHKQKVDGLLKLIRGCQEELVYIRSGMIGFVGNEKE